ncbi:LOW QUALITY PROTEIN: uncharacterized protein LOC124284394 [Haliotis rubra]|uniref:LOW QUALITY PROTEIN: uncharacterized protein LOC124284394 n=1 Tax=Haliotis rubra TaxID=36100 RepID=UPI001EE613FC|nr:LOW QUALITY PROTEIN: uncharacterized protein LOC124284394 [Haliotis rubra]
MAGRDLYPTLPDGRGSFRVGANRRVELSLQKELDDVAHRSLAEISSRKEAVRLAPLTDDQITAKKLKPEFKPQKVREKKKTVPVFHDDLKPTSYTKEHFQLIPNIPPYNPLDKQRHPDVPDKMRKFPYAREHTVTTADLKKAHVSSVGVVPTRASANLADLKVLLKGAPAAASVLQGEITLLEMEQANQAEPATPPPPSTDIPRIVLNDKIYRLEEDTKAEAEKKKPAILSQTGNIQNVMFSERQKPPPRPSYLNKRKKSSRRNVVSPVGEDTEPSRLKSARSIPSSLQSAPISLPDDAVYSKYDKAIEDMDIDMDNVETAVGVSDAVLKSRASSVKSVQDLLEEAKKISSPDSDPLYKQQHVKSADSKKLGSPTPRRSRSSRKETRKSAGKGEKSKGKLSARDTEEESGGTSRPRSERSVDEIISSLRDQSRTGIVSDADRRIQEIMDRVMSRASAVLSDIGVNEASDSPEVHRDGDADNTREVTPQTGDETSPSVPTPDTDVTLDADDPDRVKGDLSVPDRIPEEEEVPEDTSSAQVMEQTLPPPVIPDVPPPTRTTASTWDGTTEVDEEEEEEARLEEEQAADVGVDIRQAYEDLLAPPTATYEDLVKVEGTQKELQDRQIPTPFTGPRLPVYSTSVSFLSSWAPTTERKYMPTAEKEDDGGKKSIHHFCKMTSEFQLPKHFQNIGRKYHTPDQFSSSFPVQPYRFGAMGPSVPATDTIEEESVEEDEADRMSVIAQRVIDEAGQVGSEDTLEAWQQRAEEVFVECDISVDGQKISIGSDESRVYWNPAPPKLDIPPAKVREVLFPDYQRASLGPESQQLQAVPESDSESEVESEPDETKLDPEDAAGIERVLHRRYHSTEDVTALVKARKDWEEQVVSGKVDPYSGRKILTPREAEEGPGDQKGDKAVTSAADDDAATPSTPHSDHGQQPAIDDILPLVMPLRRSQSQPRMMVDEDDTVLVPQDFNTAMKEISEQKYQIRQLKIKQQQQVLSPTKEVEVREEEVVEEEQVEADILKLPQTPKEDKLTPAELALLAGRNYVILPKKKKSKRKGPVDMSRIESVQKFLASPSPTVSRWGSLPRVNRVIEWELRVPRHVRSHRSSLPNILDFEAYKTQKRYTPSEDEREWARDIWNVWFDQVYPPTPTESDVEEGNYFDFQSDTHTHTETMSISKEERAKKRKESITSVLSDTIDTLDPLSDTEENIEIIQILNEEIDKMTAQIESTDKPSAFDLCRRGALCRKIGKLKNASLDLDRAIQLEPLLLDAYWHRHLLYILQDKKQAALDDLNFIMKKNKRHAGAYRSMAEIYRRQNDITMAIVNYTQALKLNPHDHEAFFRRAEMYEQRGEMLLALEDYGKCTKLLPTRTDAIMKHGMYYFKNRNWNNAINDFTDLIRVDPLNAIAHLYRGQAYASQKLWAPAVEDMSAAIHLNPETWEAFYHRACILRKAHPKRALQDYSMSLLINDTEENIMSYLHRGILYSAMGKAEDAIPDFESVLKLNKDVACAHVNLGLIFMKKYENYHRAIKKFTSAIKVEPTYIRAYVCRGEAYHKIHELKLALRDFTRAIHLRPDVQHYYMYRGQLVLEMGNMELAAFCVRHASELSNNSTSSLGQRPTQQAIVQSFLKNYDKAIDALKNATRVKPVGSLFMLLGKTQMKAKHFKDAIDSFEMALVQFKPWRPRDPWPPETADAHFLCGVCHNELRNYFEAYEAFNSAIKFDPNYAEAFYQRGLARIKLKQSKGIQDFNRALAINPKIFQAYLSRACYYGLKGNYTKAILNCNEAIKLQPNSVRAYLYRGALKYHIRAYELAIRDLSKAASIDSTCPLAYFNRAVCYQENRQYHKALMDYGIVLLVGEQLMLKVLINRGLLYFERGDYSNALYDFQMAAKLSPWDHRIHHTLGLCFHKLGQLQEAVKTFSQCIELKPFFLDGLISRGNVYMDYGHDDGLKYARRDYERALILDPMCLAARVNLAYTMQVAGKLMQAWRHFTAAITVKPRFKPALEGRAIVNLQMSDTFAAYQDINASVKVSATAELLTNRGVIQQFMDDRVNAMKDYQEAIKLEPTYSLAYFNAANIYFHTRHFKQALEYYSRCIENNPRDESAFLNRAITKVLLKDGQSALSDFRSAIKLSPYSAHMYFNRGNLYSSMQQFDRAEKDYTKALSLQPDDALVLKRRADVRGKQGKREQAVVDYRRAIELQTRPHKPAV